MSGKPSSRRLPGATVPRGLRVGDRGAEGVKERGRGGFSAISISPTGRKRQKLACLRGGGRATAEVLFLKEAIKYNLVSLTITLSLCPYPLGAARGPAGVPGPHLRAVPGGRQDALSSPSAPAHLPRSPVPNGLITTSGALGERNSS